MRWASCISAGVTRPDAQFCSVASSCSSCCGASSSKACSKSLSTSWVGSDTSSSSADSSGAASGSSVGKLGLTASNAASSSTASVSGFNGQRYRYLAMASTACGSAGWSMYAVAFSGQLASHFRLAARVNPAAPGGENAVSGWLTRSEKLRTCCKNLASPCMPTICTTSAERSRKDSMSGKVAGGTSGLACQLASVLSEGGTSSANSARSMSSKSLSFTSYTRCGKSGCRSGLDFSFGQSKLPDRVRQSSGVHHQCLRGLRLLGNGRTGQVATVVDVQHVLLQRSGQCFLLG